MGWTTTVAVNGRQIELWYPGSDAPSNLDELEFTDTTTGEVVSVRTTGVWAGSPSSRSAPPGTVVVLRRRS